MNKCKCNTRKINIYIYIYILVYCKSDDTPFAGRGGALVESTPFDRMVVGSNPALTATYGIWVSSRISFIADNNRKTGRSRLTQPQLKINYMIGLFKFRIKRIR